MSSMTIKVEFLAGSKIEDCIAEAKEKAAKFDVAYVCFNFNGISFSIGRNADVNKAIEEWRNGRTAYGIFHS